MLKSHSGAVSSAISYVDVYVYPFYDTTTIAAAAYVTDVKSRFNTVSNPIGLDLDVQIQQWSAPNCTSPLGGPTSHTFSLPISMSVFDTSISSTEVADPSAVAVRITSLSVLGVSLDRSPQFIVTGSYVYRITGYGECGGL
jgi:hypothetical protein